MMKLYKLLDSTGKVYLSETPGVLGGFSTTKIYGEPDCRRAHSTMQNFPESYEKNRVSFPDEKTALAAGYRPCFYCLRDKYMEYKADPIAYRKKFGL